MNKKRKRYGRKSHQRTVKKRRSKLPNIGTIGVNITWRGLSTNLELLTGQAAQGRAKEEAPEGQLCHRCCRCCHCGKPLLCCTHGYSGRPGGMMVHASMRVLQVVSMHCWIKQHRTTNCDSPLPPPLSNHHLQPYIHFYPKGTSIASHPGGDNPQDGSMGDTISLLELIKKATQQQIK